MRRRTFLLAAAGVGGALIVGWGVLPPRQRLLNETGALELKQGEVALNGWVKVSRDGAVTIVVPRSEMGQGIYTALPMLLAEELGCDWSMVRVEQAPIDKIYGNVAMLLDALPFHPDNEGALRAGAEWLVAKAGRELGLMITGGSSSVKDAWSTMRVAGASAREMLVAAAAARFGVAAQDCSVAAGFITSKGGRKAQFGELVEDAAKLAPNRSPKLKDSKDYTLIGKSVARTDVPAKVDGSARFGTDVRLRGMLYAAIRMCPVIGGDVKSFDAGAIKGRKGIVDVVQVPALAGAAPGVAVIADAWWTAKSALDAMPVAWADGAHANLDSAAIFEQFKRDLGGGSASSYHSVGDVDAGFASASKTHEAEYRVPFLAHATMEPQNCTAWLRDGRLEIWAPTQAPSLVPWIAGRTLGIDSENVTAHTTLLGGGFGRRGELDMVAQAAWLAPHARGKPVQLIWSREEDMQHDMYRPAAIARFRAGLDTRGNVVAFWNRVVSGSVVHSMMGRIGFPAAGPDKTNAEGASDLPYELANHRVEHVLSKTPVQMGFWRSVGHSQNAFFTECFLDELAELAGKDSFQFRRGLLQRHPRHLAVLDLAAARAGWSEPAPQGTARGIALHESFGSIVAQVAEVSISPDRKLRVNRVVCALDCGTPVNPGIISQQMESGVVFGLTAALHGEITLKGGKVEQSNFPSYEMLRLADAPVVETHIVASTRSPGGVGEPGTPPIAPAVVNAVYALTKRRIRALPIRLV